MLRLNAFKIIRNNTIFNDSVKFQIHEGDNIEILEPESKMKDIFLNKENEDDKD